MCYIPWSIYFLLLLVWFLKWNALFSTTSKVFLSVGPEIHVVAHEGNWIPHMSKTKQWMKKDTNCRPQIPVFRFVPLMHHQLYVSMLFSFTASIFLNNYSESYSDSLFYKPIIWQFLWFYGLLFHCLWKVN